MPDNVDSKHKPNGSNFFSAQGQYDQLTQPLLTGETEEFKSSRPVLSQEQITELKRKVQRLKDAHGIFNTVGAFGLFPLVIGAAGATAQANYLKGLSDNPLITQIPYFALYGLLIFGIGKLIFTAKIEEYSQEIARFEKPKEIKDQFGIEMQPLMDKQQQLENKLDTEIKSFTDETGKLTEKQRDVDALSQSVISRISQLEQTIERMESKNPSPPPEALTISV